MKWSLLALTLSLSFNAFAQDRLLLITSFEQPKTSPLNINPRRKNLHRSSEAIFRKKLSTTSYAVDVLQDAQPFELFNIVRSGKYKGIFWISHANKGRIVGSMGSDDVVVDRNGINVKDIFFHLNPKTKFLGMIGCYTEKLAAALETSVSAGNSETIVHGFREKVDILKGLRKSLRFFKTKKLSDELTPLKDPTPKTVVRFERTADEKALPTLFFYNREKLIKVFPPVPAFGHFETEVSLELPKTANDLKIVLSTEKLFTGTISDKDFGQVNISLLAANLGSFQMMTIGNRPIGTRTRIFKFRGELPSK